MGLAKVPTGVVGLDSVLLGGLPRGRTTLMAGAAGCGKTLLALQFLDHGAACGEPGVLLSCEEPPEDLIANASSTGVDLGGLVERGLVLLDHVDVGGEGVLETGDFTLDGLILRLAAALDESGGRRVVLDAVDVLYGAYRDTWVVRRELRRLFAWLKERDVTTVITIGRGASPAARNEMEDYVADCVIVLDHRIEEERSNRRLRVLKYRGSGHGTDEYPFRITDDGVAVVPVTGLGLDQPASSERVPLGVQKLDAIVGGGVFRGSSVLVSGTVGTGKSTLAAVFSNAACERGERVLHLSYEESGDQIVRNMASVGLQMRAHEHSGLLRLTTVRPTQHSLEAHLGEIDRAVASFQPSSVVLDPVTSLRRVGSSAQVSRMLLRVVDLLKSRGVTAFFTAMEPDVRGGALEGQISSLADLWLRLEQVESNGERNRVMTVIKSRGSAHSNQLTEFRITDTGVELFEPYVGSGVVLTGSARAAQEAADQAERVRAANEVAARARQSELRRATLEAQIAELRIKLEAEAAEAEQLHRELLAAGEERSEARRDMATRRWAVADESPRPDGAGDG